MKEAIFDPSLLNRREMLLRGGKGFAAALGLAAIGGPGRRDLLNLLLPRAPLPNLAGAHLISFEPELEAEAEEALTYVPAVDTCVLTCGLTIGPCYSAAGALTRRDISAGATGLPARLAFRIIYADTCQPVRNSTVDVWHTNAHGIYSALTAQVCTTEIGRASCRERV